MRMMIAPAKAPHEISHVRNRDILIASFAATWRRRCRSWCAWRSDRHGRRP
jgi:hypothetical protein